MDVRQNSHISVIVVTYNRREYLKNCLNSILQQDYPSFDILVIDNNSSDGTVEMLKLEYPTLKTILLDKNFGCPGARNIGVLNSTGEILFFVDDDGLLERNVLSIVAEEMASEEEIGALVCAILENGHWLIRPTETEKKIRTYVHDFRGQGAIRRSVFEKVGLYPGDFYYGAEETDLAIRMIAAGYRIVFQPNALTHHFRVNNDFRKNQNLQKNYNYLSVVLKYSPVPLVYIWGAAKLLNLLCNGITGGDFGNFLKVLAKIPLRIISLMRGRKSSVVSLEVFAIREYLAVNSVSSPEYFSQALLQYPTLWSLLYSFLKKKKREK